MPNPWIEHVKEYSRIHNLHYGCALSMPECKASYKPKAKTQKAHAEPKEPKAHAKVVDLNRTKAHSDLLSMAYQAQIKAQAQAKAHAKKAKASAKYRAKKLADVHANVVDVNRTKAHSDLRFMVHQARSGHKAESRKEQLKRYEAQADSRNDADFKKRREEYQAKVVDVNRTKAHSNLLSMAHQAQIKAQAQAKAHNDLLSMVSQAKAKAHKLTPIIKSIEGLMSKFYGTTSPKLDTHEMELYREMMEACVYFDFYPTPSKVSEYIYDDIKREFGNIDDIVMMDMACGLY